MLHLEGVQTLLHGLSSLSLQISQFQLDTALRSLTLLALTPGLALI